MFTKHERRSIEQDFKQHNTDDLTLHLHPPVWVSEEIENWDRNREANQQKQLRMESRRAWLRLN